MKNVPTIIKRGRITYFLYAESVTVAVGADQYISYNQYNNWNRQGIAQFRKMIIKSKPDEYSSPVDQMSLAVQCGIKGTSTVKPKDAE